MRLTNGLAYLILIRIWSFEGSLIRLDAFTLAPGAKLVFSMPDRYPETLGKGGTITVGTLARFLSGLGLRFNPTGAFTSFHTLSVAP